MGRRAGPAVTAGADVGTSEIPERVVVRSRVALAVGGLWLLVGTILLVAGVLLLLDQGRVWLELVLAPVALAVGWVVGRSRCVFDRHGIGLDEGLRRSRVLWGTIDRIELRPGRWHAAVRLALRDRPSVPVGPTWGLSDRRRREVFGAIRALAAAHGVRVIETPPGPDGAPDAEPDGAT